MNNIKENLVTEQSDKLIEMLANAMVDAEESSDHTAKFTVNAIQDIIDYVNNVEQVLGEAYCLIGQLDETTLPDLDKWLDNVYYGKIIHTDLLPVSLNLPATNTKE